MIVGRIFAGALDITAAGLAEAGAPWEELFSGDGKTSPVTGECALGQGSVIALEGGCLTEGDQQVERRVLAEIVQQLHREVLDIGHDQGSVLEVSGQNLFSQFEQLLGGLSDSPGTAGIGQTNGLAGFGIQKEE